MKLSVVGCLLIYLCLGPVLFEDLADSKDLIASILKSLIVSHCSIRLAHN